MIHVRRFNDYVRGQSFLRSEVQVFTRCVGSFPSLAGSSPNSQAKTLALREKSDIAPTDSAESVGAMLDSLLRGEAGGAYSASGV